MSEESGIEKEPQPAAKKPYSAPKLVVYGDLRMITETMAKAGSDGGVMVGMTFSS